MSTEQRQIGCYHTKKGPVWWISYWSGRNWWVFGGSVTFQDDHFDEIDPNPIKREA